MDLLSHALWANLVFKEVPVAQRGLAVVFTVLPDIISFSFATFGNFLQKTLHYTDPPLKIIPKEVFKLYNITHSLVIWLGIYVLLVVLGADWAAVAFLGWALHILLDIFTHTKNYFPTPILWPFSRFHFSGINWSNKYFMLANYLVLIFLYWVIYF